MIFKTWITDLIKIQGVVNNIKSIELWANGATGLLNPNVVNNLSSAINGLNLQQAQLALSTRNLTQEQMHQVLVQAGLIASEDKIQAELVQSALAQSSLSTEKQKAILMELGLMNQRTLEIYTTKACTKEELLNMLATKGVTGANAEAIVSTLGLAGANGATTVSFGLLTASIWANIKALVAWLTTNPIGWLVLAAGSIFGVVKAVDALTVSFDEAVEKTKASKEELDQLTSEISDLNNELKTTESRIDELIEKANSGTISLLEEEELNNLREQNDELQREINLKEKLASIDAKEAAKDAAFSITYKTDDDKWDGEYHPEDRITKLERWLSSANHYQEELSKVNEQILNIEEAATDNSYKNDSVYQNLIKRQENYQKNIEKAEKNINSIYKELTDEDDGLYYNGKVVEGYEDLDERLNTIYTSVELYFDDGSIENTIEEYKTSIKNKLLETGLSEEISNAVAEGFSEEEINSIINSESIDWTKCLGLDSATAVIKNIKEQLASVGNTNKNPISSLTITDTIDQLNAQLKPAFDSLKSAYQDIFTTDSDGKEAFSLKSTNMLYSIRDAISKLNTVEGVSIDLSSYENFAKVLTNSSSKASDVKTGFNELASSIIDGVSVTKGFNDQTKNLCAQLLKEMGIVNADEIVLEKLNQSKIQQRTASIDFSDAADDEIRSLTAYGEELGFTSQQVYGLYLQQLLVNNDPLQTKNSILQLIGLCKSGSETADTLLDLYQIMTAISDGERKLADGELTDAQAKVTKSEIEKLQKKMSDRVNNMISSNSEVKWVGNDNSKSPYSSSSGKDTHLEEYRQKLEELQTMLDRELINEKEFYGQSDALLNDYLKDTPTHLQKYADEISGAEKTLRGNWISSFGYEKSQLEKDLSDSTLVQWQYYERLSELAQQYYNTEGASYGKFADEYGEITQEIKDGQEKLWDDIFSEVNSQIDGLQSACETVRDAVAEYSENGSLSIDTMQKLITLEPQYMAMLFDENGQLQLNAEAYERLAKTKLEELKIDLAGQALNTINSLQSEAQAVEMLTGKYAELRDTGAGAIEQQLRDAVAEAYGRGEQQGKAAEMVLQAYVNQKKVIDATDLSSLSITAEQKDSDADRFLKTFDWIGTLLKKISDSTSKLIDKADRFYSWQKKNSMINRAVKSASREISQNELAYQTYMKKANSVGLGLNYVRKVQDGTLSVEDVTDENTANKIEKYQEWYDKAQACLDTVEDLYDRQRDLIRQKLDNVLDYYSSMDSYLSSITSKIESIISLNDGMGKRTSLTELVEQFAAVSDRLENAKTKNNTLEGMTDTAVTEGSFGGSKKVAEANERDRKELAGKIQTEIDDLDVKKTGNYKKLRDKIADTQSEIDRYKNKGWDKSKAKSYEKLQKELKDYYDLQKALDENATSDTIANYEKIYTKYQKLQNKINSGKTLSESEQKRYDSYAGQLDGLKARGQSALDSLRTELAEAEGTAPKQSEAERIQGEIDGIQSDLEGTATYQNLKRNIETTESSLAEDHTSYYIGINILYRKNRPQNPVCAGHGVRFLYIKIQRLRPLLHK